MKTSEKLRQYFGHPSADLDRLLIDVEDLERASDRYRAMLMALYGDKTIDGFEEMVTEQIRAELAAEAQ